MGTLGLTVELERAGCVREWLLGGCRAISTHLRADSNGRLEEVARMQAVFQGVPKIDVRHVGRGFKTMAPQLTGGAITSQQEKVVSAGWRGNTGEGTRLAHTSPLGVAVLVTVFSVKQSLFCGYVMTS